jgi:UDP-2,3-diacylglucosamine pyrophosphatase LpxH
MLCHDGRAQTRASRSFVCNACQEAPRKPFAEPVVAVTTYNLLALSDVHLGSDLIHHVRPDAPLRASASLRRDQQLAALLDWYRDRRVGGLPWRLVIAGDFIDFTGMSVMSAREREGDIVTAPTPEELAHGLGGAADHALAKLRLVMAHHARVMEALSAFLRAGHDLVLVPGNHDADWHWESVQAEFKRVLVSCGVRSEQVEFSPWFYYEEGVIYLEHGHQYDAYCSHDHVLYPVSPQDPRRTVSSLSDILVRYIVRPTRGLMEGGHDKMNALDYVRFGLSLGVSGMLALLARFVQAFAAALELWQAHSSEAAAWIRREHEKKLRLLDDARQYGLERLLALTRLQLPPLTRSLAGIIACLMLDRVMLGLSVAGTLALIALWSDHWAVALGCGIALVLGLKLLQRIWLVRDGVEPSSILRQRAEQVARLFPSSLIVMGHTHLPEVRPSGERSTYVNLGAWAEEEPPAGGPPALPATRTHLVLTRTAAEPAASLLTPALTARPLTAQLMTWDEGGPRPFVAEC